MTAAAIPSRTYGPIARIFSVPARQAVPGGFSVRRKTTNAERIIRLEKSEIYAFSLGDGAAVSIIGIAGRCWVTVDGDAADYVVPSASSLDLRGPGHVVIEGLAGRSAFQLRASSTSLGHHSGEAHAVSAP